MASDRLKALRALQLLSRGQGTALFVIRHGNCAMVRKPRLTSRLGKKRLEILFWGLTLALELHPSLALTAIERFSGISPQMIRCGFALLSEAEIPARWTWWVVVLKT